jgi:hypothetical protein
MSFYKVSTNELLDMQQVLLLSMGSQEALTILKKVKDIYPEKFSTVLKQIEDKSLQGHAIVECFKAHRQNLHLFLGFLEHQDPNAVHLPKEEAPPALAESLQFSLFPPKQEAPSPNKED